MHTGVIKTLIEAGANINIKDNIGATVLMYVTVFGQMEMVKLLKEAEKK